MSNPPTTRNSSRLASNSQASGPTSSITPAPPSNQNASVIDPPSVPPNSPQQLLPLDTDKFLNDVKGALLSEMRAVMESVIDEKLTILQQSLEAKLELKFETLFNQKLADARTELETELTSRFDAKLKRLEEKYELIDGITAKQNTVKTKMQQMDNYMTKLDDVVEENEQRSRKYNLRFLNLPFPNKKESDQELLTLLQTKLKLLGITISESDVAHIHRMGEPRINKSGTTWKPVIVRFTNWTARSKCLQTNKKAGKKYPLRAFHDLTDVRFRLLQSSRNEIDARYRELGYSVDQRSKLTDAENMFVFVTPSCDIRLRCCGRVYKFNTENGLKTIIEENFYCEQGRQGSEVSDDDGSDHSDAE